MITVRECQYDEVEKFRKLEGDYHYMGKSHGAGDRIRLVFEEDGKWIALMTWAAACYALKPRDERIGWNPVMRASRLKLIANNRRFTELVPKGSRPNLASHDPYAHTAEEFARFVRRHWGVESYHGKRDFAYLEDKTGRRVNPQLQTMMMLARTVGLWEASRHPDMTTAEVRSDLYVNPRKAVHLSTKRGML